MTFEIIRKPVDIGSTDFTRANAVTSWAFLLHVLPVGMVRIRGFGFLANRVRKQKLEHCRALLAACAAPIPIDSEQSTTTVEDPRCCPICKLGRLVVIGLISVETTAVLDTS